MPTSHFYPIEVETFQRDGRPLCTVPLTKEKHASVGRWVQEQLKRGEITKRTAVYFVLWAAEHIRANFQGGRLTWDFVFGGLGLSGQLELGQKLAVHGLSWWNRPIRVSKSGMHLYLYSLMAAGGLPEALLVQQGLYGRVLKGLLADFEAEGSDLPEDLAYRISAQRVEGLPQTFQTEEIARLLAEFGLCLVRLRKLPPQDVPAEVIDSWLDRNSPGWAHGLPLRISQEIADQLVRPALREERVSVSCPSPLAQRSLIRDARVGKWLPVVRLSTKGALSASLLPPDAQSLRLRFQLTGDLSDQGGTIVYSASPVTGGWELHRLGRGIEVIEFALDKPVTLAGYADGRLVGEVEIEPAISFEDELPVFWKEADRKGLECEATELLPMGETLKTRMPRIWLYTSGDTYPLADEGVICGEKQAAQRGWLWPLQGRGAVWIGEQSRQIATGADEEASVLRMLAQGQALPVWRLATTGGQVYLGKPRFYGQNDAGTFRSIANRELRIRPARMILGEIVEWLEGGECVARLRYVALPDTVRLSLSEGTAGRVCVQAEGFPENEDWALALEAGSLAQRVRLMRGRGRIELEVTGAPPGIVWLRIGLAGRGEIRIVAPWPAHNGMLLRPDGSRVDRHELLAVDALRGWRAVVPQSLVGEVLLLAEGQCVAMRVGRETSLSAYVPLIRSMLAYAGPDSVVKLSLLIHGVESPRLDIRRYQQESELTKDGKLRLGLNSSGRAVPGQDGTDNIVQLHAVNLLNPERIARVSLDGLKAPIEIDLRAELPEGDGAWILQPLLNGQVQRAKVWFPTTQPVSSREQRIREYADDWRRLAGSRERTEWKQRWGLMQAVMEGGDVGILDQVQALARVPSAAVRLLLNVPKGDLAQVLALEMATPIFWPAVPAAAFAEALTSEHDGLVEQFTAVFENENEARESALSRIANRVEAILLLHPELASHFGVALMEAGLFLQAPVELLQKVAVAGAADRLFELAQEAARRIDFLPSGIEGLKPNHRPAGMPLFDSSKQIVIDAPLVAAEMAAGLRTDLNHLGTALRLINLRMADPQYFDSALPVALAVVLKEINS
jgi:hypothetical protein